MSPPPDGLPRAQAAFLQKSSSSGSLLPLKLQSEHKRNSLHLTGSSARLPGLAVADTSARGGHCAAAGPAKEGETRRTEKRAARARTDSSLWLQCALRCGGGSPASGSAARRAGAERGCSVPGCVRGSRGFAVLPAEATGSPQEMGKSVPFSGLSGAGQMGITVLSPGFKTSPSLQITLGFSARAAGKDVL